MITPLEAHRMCSRSDLKDRLEKKVDEEITASSLAGRWPCTITITGEFAPFASDLAVKYRAVGWRVQIFDSQVPSEDPFIQFERPKL